MPYMLAGEGLHGNKPIGSVWHQSRPPLLLGGLNLLWILFTISILENASKPARQSAKDALLWIGKSLGIGQANLLAHVRIFVSAFLNNTNVSQMEANLPGGVTAKGDALRWTGFLI